MKKLLRKISHYFGPRSMEQVLSSVLPGEIVQAAALKFDSVDLLEGLAAEHQLNAEKLLELVGKRLKLSRAVGLGEINSKMLSALSADYREQSLLPLASTSGESSERDRAFAVADPFSTLARELRQQGAQLQLALPSEIRRIWELSNRESLSAGARAMLDLLLNDAARFSATEVELGLPTADSFSFKAQGRQYQGKLHPAVLKELLSSSLEFLEFEIQGEIRRLAVLAGSTESSIRLNNITSASLSSAVSEQGASAYDVLLVEDDERFAFILEQALSSKELRLKRVRSVAEGLSLIRVSRRGSFRVVICDLNLPGEDGRDFLRLARELDPKIAIVMLTSEESKEVKAELLELGANAYVKKNDDPRLLLAWVHNLSERDGRLRKYA